MSEHEPLVLPAKKGQLELRADAGRCVVDGCGIRGGGLIRIQNTTANVEEIPDLAWKGQAIVVCGGHLIEVLTAVLRLP